MKKLKAIAALAALTLVILGLAGCSKEATVIDVSKYVDVTFEGYDSLGTVTESEFDAKKLLNEYQDNMKDATKKDLTKIFGEAYQISKADHLSNGEAVKVTWKVDEDDLAEFEQKYNVKFEYDSFEITVNGLTEMEKVDLFDGVDVSFLNMAPNGNARLVVTNYDYDVYYRLDKNTELSNGDTVTVTVYPGDDSASLAEFIAKKYQKIPMAETKTFTVSGLSQRVTELSQLSATIQKDMDAAAQEKIIAATSSWKNPDSLQCLTSMGTLVLTKENNNTDFVVLYVYKVDVDSIVSGAMSYYTYVQYYNLILDGNGQPTTDLANNSRICTASFTANNLRYYGYQTYEDLPKTFEANYTIDSKVDTSIITKVTHEPIDFSKPTATATLSADCFTYSVIEGSYFVNGFTQKGSDEIHKYSANDIISITLPAATENGDVVEGFSATSKDYNLRINRIFDDNAPCFVLVCPDTYSKFYGFANDAANYKLRGIVLGKEIIALKESAFNGCTGITSITLPDGIDTIPVNAFSGCTMLKEVTLPKELLKIDRAAFYNCTALDSINLPDTILEIGNEAFYNCTSLTIDTFDISGKTLGYRLFYGATVNNLMFSENGYTAHRSDWGDGETFTKAHINKITIGEEVLAIPDYTFADALDVTEVVLPKDVTSIGKYAFSNCTSLTKVTFPDSLLKIGEGAFSGCSALQTAELPYDILTIEKEAFNNCSNYTLSALDLGEKTIGLNAFNQATIQKVTLSSDLYVPTYETIWGDPVASLKGALVKEIVIGEYIEKIPDHCFACVAGVTEITIPENVTVIGLGAFLNCQSIKEITLSSKLTEILQDAFNGCSSLKSIVIPDSVTLIDTSAFSGCSSLTIDTLEISGRKLGADAFNQATINTVTYSKDGFTTGRYTSWGEVYTHWAGATVKALEIKEGVTVLPKYIFENITTLSEITVPSTVTTIEAEAFARCTNLRKLHLPKGLAEIDKTALTGCSDLVIYSAAGSVGESFAKLANFFFKAE